MTRRRLSDLDRPLEGADLKRVQDAERRNRARARKKEAEAVFVDVGRLYEDQDRICGCVAGCGRALNPTARWPDDDTITIGHLYGLAAGGAHKPGFVILERLDCNLADGRNVVTPAAAHIVRMKKAHETGRGRARKGQPMPYRKFDGTPVWRPRNA
jgi:hypothetical protein